jgi:hypothetical protein
LEVKRLLSQVKRLHLSIKKSEYDEFDEIGGKKIRDNKLDDADTFHSV